MSIEELKQVEEQFIVFKRESSIMKLFHNKESGEVIVIIYNPNILGITKLRDLLTLNAEGLRNLLFYYRTRDKIELDKILEIFRVKISSIAIYDSTTLNINSIK